MPAFRIWLEEMCFLMYGVAPGILLGAVGGFVTWWRTGPRADNV